jgi:hypothetical protein
LPQRRQDIAAMNEDPILTPQDMGLRLEPTRPLLALDLTLVAALVLSGVAWGCSLLH